MAHSYHGQVRDPHLPAFGWHLVCLTLGVLTTWQWEWLFYSNHGSYYYRRLAALQILANNTSSANATIENYFSTLYEKSD